MYLGKQHFLFQSPISQKIQFVFGRTAEQKGKKEGGWGEGIFALLRLELERFLFPLIKRKPKQKIFHLLLKEKNGGQKKIKNVMKKFLFWFAVAERRQAETHLIILDFAQNKFGFQATDTAIKKPPFRAVFLWRCVLNEVRMYFELNPDDQ